MEHKKVKYVGLDNIHYDFKPILSLNKAFNFVISPREPGKSTQAWLLLYRQFVEKGRRLIVFKRQIADITESYIDDIATLLNKFLPSADAIRFVYTKGALKDGVCNVYVYNKDDKVNSFQVDEEHLFFRVIALSIPIIRVKSQMLRNLEWLLFDEFIPNTTLGEKYLHGEVFKFKEIYNTFQRESQHLRSIFLGNPYSLYNVYFAWLEVNIKNLHIGTITTGNTYAIEFAQITPELREYILKKNPLYQFDDSYTRYAFNGQAINDDNVIIVDNEPRFAKLIYVFRVDSKLLGVYRCVVNDTETDIKYWLCVLKDYDSVRRKIACFEVNDLLQNSYIPTGSTSRFDGLIKAYRWRQLGFKDLEASYLMNMIYELL